ncbi:hypothetical protein J2S71_000903 [Olsenella profusa DSM 13989]|uniref:hypothetical protein n=1 Tax=Olsenella profusa TaxID=138595 RepID=UPI00278A0239|nr:hypothetical protein [Olsenella profusa]MDP9859207.1 hypothetical protein [Olsenella profusa DSM 13989]
MGEFMRRHRRGALVALLALAVAVGARAALDRAGTAGGGDGGQAQVQSQPADGQGRDADADGGAEGGAESDEEDAEAQPIVPESERVAPEGTRRLRLPGIMTGGSVPDAQRYARGLLDASPRTCEAAYANEDGTVDIWQTREQVEEVVRRVLVELDSAREELASGDIDLEMSGDHRSVTFTVGPGASREDLAYGISRAVPGATYLQVEETGGEDFALSVDIVDGTTGRVMGHFDQDTYRGWSMGPTWVGEGEAS